MSSFRWIKDPSGNPVPTTVHVGDTVAVICEATAGYQTGIGPATDCGWVKDFQLYKDGVLVFSDNPYVDWNNQAWGYAESWNGTATSPGTWTFTAYSAGSQVASLTITILAKTHNLTTSAGPGGTITPGSGAYSDVQTIVATANADYQISSFKVTQNGSTLFTSAIGTTASCGVNMDSGDAIASATFIKNQTMVDFTVSGTTKTYDGSALPVRVIPGDGNAVYGITFSGGPSYAGLTAGQTVSGPTNAGTYTYTITVTGPDSSYVAGSGTTGSVTISPKPVTFTFGNTSSQYTGGTFNATATASDPSATFSRSLSYGPTAGDSTVSATANGNYSGNGTATATVTRKPVTFTFGNTSNQYTGGSFTATVSPSDPNATFTSSLSYGPAEGSYSVSATASGNYVGGDVATASVTAQPPDVSATINASPNSATAPGSTTISWSSSNATSVSVSGPNMSTSSAASGSVDVAGLSAGTYTYTITAQGNGGPITRTADVTVSAAVPTVSASISASPASTTSPGAATITWSSSNATAVSVSGPSMTTSNATSGSANVTGLAAGSYTYTITAQGNGGPVSRTATVTVSAPSGNVTATISSAITTATAPGAAMVTWSSSNATSVSVSGPGVTTSTAMSGSATVSGLAAGTYSYTITAQGAGGPVTQTTTVNIGDSSITGTLAVSITNQGKTNVAGPDNAWRDYTFSLKWTSTNASSVVVSGPGIETITSTATEGIVTTSPLGPGAYQWTITGQGQDGPKTATADGYVIGYGNDRVLGLSTDTNFISWCGDSSVKVYVDSNIAGPGIIIIHDTYGGDRDWPVTFNGQTHQYVGTYTSAPVVSSYSSNTVTFEARGADQYGGNSDVVTLKSDSTTYFNNDNATITPTSATAAPGQTVTFMAGSPMATWKGITTPRFKWTGTNASSASGSASLTIPANATVGSVYWVGVYSIGQVVCGKGGYLTGSDARASVTVVKGTPSITWSTPAAITYGSTLSSVQLNAVTPDTTGTFVYTPAAGTILPVGSHTLNTTFTPSNTAAWYGAAASTTLSVNAAPLTVVPDNQTRVYGASNPTLTAAYRGLVNGDTPAVLTAVPTLSTTATSSSPVGTYAITASGGAADNYTLAYGAGALTITAKPVAITFTGDGTQTYDGTAKTVAAGASDPSATVSITYSGSAGTSYGPTAIAPTAAGTYTVTATATGNHSGTASTTLTIAKATPAITWSSPAAITYGTALSGAQLDATSNVPGLFVYSPAAGSVLGAGSQALAVTFTPTDGANYATASASVALTVSQAMLTVTADDQSKVYGTPNPALTVRYAGFVNGQSAADLTTVPTAATLATVSSPVGTYPVTVTGGTAANYKFNYVAGTLTVTKASASVALGGLSATYDGAAKSATATSTPAGLDISFTYNGAASAPTTTGSYAVVATVNDPNYQGAATGTLTIVKAAPVVSWTAPASITYGTWLGSAQLNATANIPGTFTYAPAAGTVLGAGTQNLGVTFTPTDATNFEAASRSVFLTVNPAPLTVTAADATRTYGAMNPGFSATASGFVNGDTTAVVSGAPNFSTPATTASAVGTYAITPSAGTLTATNYTFSSFVSGTLTVTKAELAVTANNKARVYGAPNPAFDATITGFVNGDTAAVVSGTPAIATSATIASGAGTYSITPALGTLTAWNYSFGSFVDGTLTVTKAALMATADNQSRPYGAANPALTIRYSGFVNGDTASAITPPSISTNATASSEVGSYPITLAGGLASNYTLALVDGTLDVMPASLTATADNHSRIFGSANPPLTITYRGFVNGDTAEVIAAPVAATAAAASTGVGTYPITLSGGAATNYRLTLVQGALTVLPKPVTFTFGNLSGVYDGSTRTATVTPSDPDATFVSDVTKGPSAGLYSVTATATGNYTGSGTALLSINRAPVIFMFANTQHVYDGTQKTALVRASDVSATYTTDLTKGPDVGTYVVTATATGDYSGAGTAELVITPATQTISLNPTSGTVFVGQPAAFTATGGANNYTWGGNTGATGSSGSVNLTFANPGQYTLTVFNAASNNYQQSNTATARIDVVSNHQVNSLTPVASNYTVTDPNSPMNGQTYRRLWEEGGWKAYLGRAGVRFAVNAQAWPAVKAIELESKAPGGDWTRLGLQNPADGVTQIDATFSVKLGETAPDQPLVPLSFQQGSPQTGPWMFRARVQDANGVWSEYSSVVSVDVVLPVVTKTISGQTVPPAGALGDWFTASAVQTYSIPLWIP